MSSPPDTQDVVDIESISDVEDDKGPSSPPCSPAPVSSPNYKNEVSYVISGEKMNSRLIIPFQQ